MKVLGIETSCDETGIAVYDSASGGIWQRLYSQIEKHREYGGVVPELASRDHVVKAAPMLEEILAEIGGIDDILDTDGQAVQSSHRLAPETNIVSRSRLLHRHRLVEVGPGPDRILQLVDARKAGSDQFL